MRGRLPRKVEMRVEMPVCPMSAADLFRSRVKPAILRNRLPAKGELPSLMSV